MLSIIYILLLISCSAFANSENEAPEMPSQPESLRSLMANYGKHLAIQKVRPNIVFCCICQEAVRQAQQTIYQKMQEKIHKVCSMYTPVFQKKCLQRAGRIRDRIMHTIFPGGSPRGICSKIKFCS